MFLSEDEARYDDILKLFNHYKTLANNLTMTKFTTLWESILFPKLTDNYYYPNIRYSEKWNKQYIEHYLIKETSPTADWEINFNVNNIHALITNGDILPEYRKFKSIKQYIFLWNHLPRIMLSIQNAQVLLFNIFSIKQHYSSLMVITEQSVLIPVGFIILSFVFYMNLI